MHNMNGDSSDLLSIVTDGSPCVFISGEQEKLEIIT